jgi:hypothetical protein
MVGGSGPAVARSGPLLLLGLAILLASLAVAVSRSLSVRRLHMTDGTLYSRHLSGSGGLRA